MKLADLKTRVQETLGLDVVSMPAIATCINNCIASLESKAYREYFEEELDLIKTTLPYTVLVPTQAKRIVYVKVKTDSGIYICERIPVTDPYLQARKIDDDYRVPATYEWVYYLKEGTIYVDNGSASVEVEKIIVGCDKKIPEISLSVTEEEMNHATNPTTIDIRKDLETAFVFYALSFFANRYRFRPETVAEYDKQYKYFVEDILVQLDKEDAYLEDQEITIGYE